jgi:hypothetical protein
MTRLTAPIRRLTKAKYGKRQIVVVLAPAGTSNDALIAFRPQGQRTQYLTSVSTMFRLAALWHGNKESIARRAARKAGIPWRIAKKQFAADNTIRETSTKTQKGQ